MRQIDRSDDVQPLGPPIRREPAVPQQPEWSPTGTPGIERNRDGQLRNVTPTPPIEVPDTYVYIGSPDTWGRAIEAILRGK